MKTFMLTTALVAATAVSASAQDLFVAKPDPTTIHASDFIGMRIYASEAAIDTTDYAGKQDGWQDIGEINDVILTRDGAVSSVLVDVGGFLGIGERQVALSMPEVRFVNDTSTADNPDDFFLVVNASRAIIEGAPAWGISDTTMPATAETPAPATMAEGATDTTVTDTNSTMPTMMVEGYAAVDLANMTAEDLIGAWVYGPDDSSIAEVSDVKIGGDGKVTDVVLDVGGFLGLGEKSVAVPLEKAQILKKADGDEIRVYVPMDKEALKALPEVARS